MVKILTFFAIVFSVSTIVSAPYIAALAYTTVSILQPQFVWFWAFDSFSIFKISAGIAIVAWFIHMFRGGINWSVYNNGIFYSMLILCVLYYLSDILTPFQTYRSSVSSELVINNYTIIVFMFFMVLGLIDSKKALNYMVYVVIAVTLYYTYWANMAYLESNWAQFTQSRLRGPSGSPYGDGNAFSILFVIGLPFVLFTIYRVDKTWQKALLLLSVPFIWHAMILCASRGALVSAGVSTLVAAGMIKSKSFNIALILGLALLLIDQGGVMVDRSVSTVRMAEAELDAPINPRILSWQVGADLAMKYPMLGVGPERFLEASRFHYPGKSPHVAHNTFLNFAANLGLLAGFIYLSFFWISWKMYKWNRDTLVDYPDQLHTYINKASISSLVGFFVGGLFLDLIIFEPFYFLLLIMVVNNFLLKQKVAKAMNIVESSSKQLDRVATRESFISSR